jgi:hypothetical protein
MLHNNTRNLQAIYIACAQNSLLRNQMDIGWGERPRRLQLKTLVKQTVPSELAMSNWG